MSPYIKEKHLIDAIDAGNWPSHLTDQVHKFILFLQYYTYIITNHTMLSSKLIGDISLKSLTKTLKKTINICIEDLTITIDLAKINDVDYLKSNFRSFNNPYGVKLVEKEKNLLFLNDEEIQNRTQYFNYVSNLLKQNENEMSEIVDVIDLPDTKLTLSDSVKSNDYTFYEKGTNIKHFISWIKKNNFTPLLI